MKITFLIALLCLYPLTSACSQTPSNSYLIQAGKMYDSENNLFLTNQEIHIQNNRIINVGQNLTVTENTVVLDYSNATVTPGLADMHTHILTQQGWTEELYVDAIRMSDGDRLLRGVNFLKSYLEAGFTAVRDLGNSGQYLDVDLRNAINNDLIEGPRMFVSGPIIGSYDGQFGGLSKDDHEWITKQEYRVVNGADDARMAVRESIVQSVSVIKILAFGNILSMSQDELSAVIETAHNNRITVTAHADRDFAARLAIEAGVDGIEHGYNLSDATLDMMLENEVYYVPTIPSVDLQAAALDLMNQEYTREELEASGQYSDDFLMRAYNKGVTIVAGSDVYYDFGIPRGEASKHTLLKYFEAGMPPSDVLRTATYNASAALNLVGQIGVIKENALADIVIFNGDLEENFKESLFNVDLVMKDGKIAYQSDL